MILQIESFRHPHDEWLEPGDLMQVRYERSRRAALSPGARGATRWARMLQLHGMAGLFLEPERTLLGGCPPSRRRRQGTAFHHTHLPEEKFEAIASALAEGVGVNATGRIFGSSKKTVLNVLARAAEHAAKVSRSLLHGVPVSECQLDEMWSFIGKKQGNLEPIEALHTSLGDAWIWIALDAAHKIVLAHVVGKRTTPHATQLLKEVQRVTASMPALFSSDQLDAYPAALLQVYGELHTPPRRPGPGRPPKPRLVPPESLCYVQVVKKYKGRRVVEVSRRVVFGNSERIDQMLKDSPWSQTINTAYVERNNATIRHSDARCNRKSYRFSKCKRNHEYQLALSLANYHFCRPHRTLSASHRRPTTPFMAAGLTDHVWTMRDLLEFHVAPACP